MKRLTAMQLCPEFTSRAEAAVRAAASRSASARTMKGSLPPSSRTVFLSSRPAAAATSLPARSLPVRVTARTRGSAINADARPEPTRTVLNKLSGKPAARKSCSSSSAHRRTFEACFRTAAFPAIKAGAAKRTTCQKGKFHGMIASTGPSGSKRT